MSQKWVPLHELRTLVLNENLHYLASRQHELATLLRNHSSDEALELRQAVGLIQCRSAGGNGAWVFGGNDPRSELVALREQIQTIPNEVELIILIGASAGYALAGLIPRLLREGRLRVAVIEPSAARIHLSLALVDARAALATERLHFAVAELSPQSIAQALESFNLIDERFFDTFISPEFKDRFDASELQSHIRDRLRESVRLQQEKLRCLADTTAKRDVIRKALIVNCWQGVAGGLHLKAIRAVLAEWGVETNELVFSRHRIDAAPIEHRRLVERRIIDAFERMQPNLVISFGYHAPQFVSPEIYDSLKAHWVQAVSNIAYCDNSQYPDELTVLIEENLIPIFRQRGYRRLMFLPLMADYVREVPVETNARVPIVFVGNSLAMAPQAQQEFWNRWRGRNALITAIREAEVQLSDFDHQINFYDYLDQNPIPQSEGEEERYAIFRYLLCMATAGRRRRVLEALAPYGLLVFGGDWDAYLPAGSPLRACLQGYLPLEREPEVFSHGRIFVNVHSVGHVTGVNMRFFNVGGMGAFQLSDGPQFNRYLRADRETAYAASVKEYVEKTRRYLDDAKERDEIRCAAQERVKKDWTYRNWLRAVFIELGVRAPIQPTM